MDIRGIRLHRHPAIDFSALALSLVAAFLFLHLAGAHAEHLDIPAAQPRFDADSAFLTTKIISANFGNRVTGAPGARNAAAYVAARFRALGLTVTTQGFPITIRGAQLAGRNVIGRSAGSEPGMIVLVAHYDGQPTSDQSAGDNASGVGVLLELARNLELRGHRHPIMYVATDASEWGMQGARVLASSLDPSNVVAVIAFDHVENGTGKAIRILGEGQNDDDYAPMWLRRGAAGAFAAEGVRTIDDGTLEEWIHRVLGITFTDQGRFVEQGIAAIDLDVVSNRPDYAKFLYHTPGDRWETLRAVSFQLLGAGAERLVVALDRAPTPHGPVHYLGLGDERMVTGLWILLAAVALFVPLVIGVWDAWQAAVADPASLRAIRSELVRAGGWWLIAIAGLLAVWACVAVGLLPAYQGAPATVRDPFLYATRWPPILATAAVMVAVAFLLNAMRKKPGLVVSHPLAGRAAALSTLLLMAVVTLVHNPFAAVWLLVLPAWLWPWIGPSRRPLTGASGALIAVVSVLPVVAAIAVLARPLSLGTSLLWYLFLQVAYRSWSPLTVVMAVVTVLAAFRLVGTATARLIPAEGD
jgi:hypothetical protein